MTAHRFTRRETGSLLLFAAAAGAFAGPADAAEAFDIRLARELNTRFLPGAAGRFTVIGFGSRRIRGRVAMAAVVRLDWPPGWRSRRFDVAEDTAEDAYRQLFNTSLLEFQKAWPDGIA